MPTPSRLPHGASAPVCSWPAGCRKATWDLTGRCPHHRHAHPTPPTSPAADPLAADPLAVDPLAVPTGEALLVADPSLDAAAAALLADRGVTPETWPTWKGSAGGGTDTAGITVTAIDSGISLADLDGLPAGPGGDKLRAYPDVTDKSFTYFDGPAVVAWAAAEPDLGPLGIKALVQAGVRPDDPGYRSYRDAGVSSATTADWMAVPVDPEEAAAWDRLAVTPDDAAYLAAAGRAPADLAGPVPAGYLPPDEWPAWTYSPAARADLWATGVSEADWSRYRRQHISGLGAARLARSGVTPGDYEQWRRHAASADIGRRVEPDLIAAAAEAGTTLADAERFADCRVPPQLWAEVAAAGGTGDHLHETLFFDVDADQQTSYAPRAAARADLPAGMYRRLLRHPNAAIAVAAATNPRIDPADIDDAVADPDNLNRDGVAASATAATLRRGDEPTPALWAAAAASPSPSTRHLVASSPAAPPDLLTVLAADPAPNVRAAAAANPNLAAAGRSAAGLLSD